MTIKASTSRFLNRFLYLQLLQYIGHTSPECLEALDTPLNAPAPAPSSHIAQLEDEMLSTVLSQRNAELDYLGPRHCENM